MMTKKKTYVQPRIEEYDIQPCVPLAVSVTQGKTEDLKDSEDVIEWDN